MSSDSDTADEYSCWEALAAPGPAGTARPPGAAQRQRAHGGTDGGVRGASAGIGAGTALASPEGKGNTIEEEDIIEEVNAASIEDDATALPPGPAHTARPPGKRKRIRGRSTRTRTSRSRTMTWISPQLGFKV